MITNIYKHIQKGGQALTCSPTLSMKGGYGI